MELIISGRHFEVGEDLREYTEIKMAKLEDEHPKLTTARVVMITERNWQVVEIHLNGKHLTLNAKAQSSDMMVSVDAAVDKLERQLRRHLERVQDHRIRRDDERADAADDSDAEALDTWEGEVVPTDN